MARHVTIRRTKTTTEELPPPWKLVLSGYAAGLATAGALLLAWALLAILGL